MVEWRLFREEIGKGVNNQCVTEHSLLGDTLFEKVVELFPEKLKRGGKPHSECGSRHSTDWRVIPTRPQTT